VQQVEEFLEMLKIPVPEPPSTDGSDWMVEKYAHSSSTATNPAEVIRRLDDCAERRVHRVRTPKSRK
jgi:hypothetical protein